MVRHPRWALRKTTDAEQLSVPHVVGEAETFDPSDGRVNHSLDTPSRLARRKARAVPANANLAGSNFKGARGADVVSVRAL